MIITLDKASPREITVEYVSGLVDNFFNKYGFYPIIIMCVGKYYPRGIYHWESFSQELNKKCKYSEINWFLDEWKIKHLLGEGINSGYAYPRLGPYFSLLTRDEAKKFKQTNLQLSDHLIYIEEIEK
jgi:hypothetical protein